MRLPPWDVIASWPPANHVNPVTRGPGLLITEIVIISVTLIVLSLRMYVRIFKLRKVWLDDWLMLAGTVFSVGVTTSVLLATTKYGWDIHVWDLTYEQTVRGRQVSIAAQTLFTISSGLTKTSILVSYLRIAPLDSWFRRLTWYTIWVTGALVVIFMIVLWTQCIPSKAYWTLITGPECIAEGPPLMGQSITTVLNDFAIYILPLPTLFGLKLPITQRIGLACVFSIGFLVVVAGCMRTYWTHYTVDQTYDVTWYGFNIWIWTSVEANLGVICGSMPILRALFRASSRNSSAASRNTPRTGASGGWAARYPIARISTTLVASKIRDGSTSWALQTTTGVGAGEVDKQRGENRAKYREIATPETTIEMVSWMEQNKQMDDGRRGSTSSPPSDLEIGLEPPKNTFSPPS